MNRPVLKTTKTTLGSGIVEVDINSIKLWAENPRKNDIAAPKLAETMKVRGQITPVVVWNKNGVCYKGNTTIKALRLLGKKSVKVLYVDFPSEAAAIAYGIADNKSSEWSQWDDSVLLNFLEAPEVLNDSGFTQGEYEGLAMLPNFEEVNKINAENSGLKDKIIVLVLDAAKKEHVRELIEKWIQVSQLKGIEIK